jgi:hypothetical protein
MLCRVFWERFSVSPSRNSHAQVRGLSADLSVGILNRFFESKRYCRINNEATGGS